MYSAPFDPPARLLTGPGPSNPDPRVIAAMQRPMLGHLDPDLHELLLDTVELLRHAWRAPEDALVLAFSSTGTSAMEAGIVNLVAPGETIVVANAGFFGARITQIARRHGVNVIELKAEHGRAVPNSLILATLDRHPHARLVAVVHAETSTGVEHPLEQLGLAIQQSGHRALLMADCVTSLGGIELDFARAELDYAFSCTQKCLGAPPGMAPVALSARARERLQSRTHQPPFSLDLSELERYWIERPATYHHTAPILNIYALHEALRLVAAEGLEPRWRRHRVAGSYLQQGIQALGLELLAEPHRQLAPLTAVLVPDGVDRAAMQSALLREHGIEVGGGLGPDAPSIWRIGLMGHNANEETAERVLSAFEIVLDQQHALVAA
ncbi:MAG TPA: aminotransferase class V-fold PLP-dependent enzyme [Solirubrobacteraceae bacterium]|jgi:alanine-glyoxylate transaminase/serine-glyoxylate transaminase/serine-pyruvate transaminase|nr:aminotransferase class V-fold PLP-dependent enzyme [Solirubrobacteraceae bacterium]